jgi:hypothetical protein
MIGSTADTGKGIAISRASLTPLRSCCNMSSEKKAALIAWGTASRACSVPVELEVIREVSGRGKLHDAALQASPDRAFGGWVS